MTLYQLDDATAKVHEELLALGGEPTPELAERLEKLEFDTREKVDGYRAVEISLDAEELMWEAEEKRCHGNRLACKKAKLILMTRLRSYMDINGLTELNGHFHTVKIAKNGGNVEVEVLVPEQSLPDQFVTKTANKKYLREYIKQQADPDGIFRWEGIPIAKLGERGTSLRWS